jgi:hypothetical protein
MGESRVRLDQHQAEADHEVAESGAPGHGGGSRTTHIRITRSTVCARHSLRVLMKKTLCTLPKVACSYNRLNSFVIICNFF